MANPTAADLGTAEGSGASSREASTYLRLRETAKEKTACVFLYVQTEHVHTPPQTCLFRAILRRSAFEMSA